MFLFRPSFIFQEKSGVNILLIRENLLSLHSQKR